MVCCTLWYSFHTNWRNQCRRNKANTGFGLG